MILQNKYLKLFLFLTLIIALLASINIGARRFQFEISNNNIDIAVSYSDIEELSTWGGGKPPESILARLKDESSITSVAIEEDTLYSFQEQGRVTVLKGSEIMNMYRVGHVNRYLLTHLYREVKVKPDRFYLIIDEDEDYEQIRDFLSVEFGQDNVKKIGRNKILEVVGDRKELLDIGLGVSKRKVDIVQSLGLNPIIYMKNTNRLSKELIKIKISRFVSDIPNATLFFDGKTVLGYPEYINYVADKVSVNNLKVGAEEFSQKLGAKTLFEQLPENVVRVHTINHQELAFTPMNKAVLRYLRAAKERGIKILFVHPYFQVFEEQDIVNFNTRFIKEITTGLKDFGFTIAAVSELPVTSYIPASHIELFVLSLGVLATILFLIHYYIPLTVMRFFLVNVFFGGAFYLCYWLNFTTFWNQLLATMVAILFPTLALISQFPNEKEMAAYSHRLLPCVYFFLKVFGICLVGAFLIVGLLSDIRFVFGIERFFGVKISFLLPLLFIGSYFYLRPHRISSIFYILRRMYYAPVRTAALISIGICLASVAVLIMRSGNHMVFPSLFFEEKFRTFLETVLFVRPRTKEFMIGYPLLFLAFMMIDRHISRHALWFLGIGGAVALISVINSFCHVHTPLNISLYRSVLSIILGFFVGAFYVLVAKLILRVYKKLV
jgi:hypothetical protein